MFNLIEQVKKCISSFIILTYKFLGFPDNLCLSIIPINSNVIYSSSSCRGWLIIPHRRTSTLIAFIIFLLLLLDLISYNFIFFSILYLFPYFFEVEVS